MAWVQSGEYGRIVRGDYRRRDEPTNVREEAGDAVGFYTERFRAVFWDAAENLPQTGNQLGEVGQQLADWIRSRAARGPVGG